MCALWAENVVAGFALSFRGGADLRRKVKNRLSGFMKFRDEIIVCVRERRDREKAK